MEKEQDQKPEINTQKNEDENIDASKDNKESSKEKNLNTDNETDIDEPKVEKSSEEIILELEDKLTRTFAEMENQRRRFEKEKEEAFEYGGFSFAKEALGLIDNLERSKKILESDETLKNSVTLKKTLEHFEIINKDLTSVFSKNNIKPIDCLDKKLDPNYHQAMMEIEDDQKEPGTIIQEIQKGFTFRNRLLRPSLVAVSKKNSNKDKKIEENKENLENKF